MFCGLRLMDRAPLYDRLLWVLAAASALALVAFLVDFLLSGRPINSFVFFPVIVTAGGSAAAIWHRYIRSPSRRMSGTTVAFVIGGAGSFLVVNPITALFGTGWLALTLLPLIVVVVLGVAFRPVFLYNGR